MTINSEYGRILKLARSLKKKIGAARTEHDQLRVEFMLLLVELKAQDLLWRPVHDKWRDLLKTEKLCSVTSFECFEFGVRLLSIEEAEQYGVTSLVTLTRTPTSYRKRLIKNLRAWYGHQTPPPTPKNVSRWIWRRRRELAPENEFVGKAQLLRYVDALKQQLKKAGIRPKPLSRVK